MTCLALSTKAPLVNILFAVAAVTGFRCIMKCGRDMALLAFNLHMATRQREARLVVIKLVDLPSRFLVTALALIAKLALVLVVTLVT